MFSQSAAAELEEATYELHNMCLEAVEAVVLSDRLMDQFEIPPNLRGAIRADWEKGI